MSAPRAVALPAPKKQSDFWHGLDYATLPRQRVPDYQFVLAFTASRYDLALYDLWCSRVIHPTPLAA